MNTAPAATAGLANPAAAAQWAEARDNRLVANLAALWAYDVPLARRLEAVDDADLPHLVQTRTGAATTSQTTEAGQTVWLNSRHDPEDEARRLVADIEIKDSVCFCVQGVGLGYHLAALLERAGGDTFILAFEPDARLLRRAMECVDLTKPIRQGRISFLPDTEKATIFRAVGSRTIMISMGMATLAHPASQRLRPEFHAAVTAALEDYASFSRTSLNTIVLNGRKTAENIARNCDWYARADGIGPLKDLYKGKPAIIVAAGPSLQKNKHLLKQASDGALLIAVQTILKPLLAMGIEPDFVTSLDYSDISSRFFEGLPEGLKTVLVAEAKATKLVMRMHTGPLAIVGSEYADSILREIKGLRRPRLAAGATVAHLAFYLARWMGCDPSSSLGRTSVSQMRSAIQRGPATRMCGAQEVGRFCTMEMKQWDQIVRERPILRRIPDVHGVPMYTEERLFTYLLQFERDFAESPQKVLDCTEGGALKRGATPMLLAGALAEHCRAPLKRIHPVSDSAGDSAHSVANSLARRASEADSIRAVAIETLPLLKEISKHVGDQPRVNQLIARVDPLRARMNELGQTYDLAMQMSQKTELLRFERDLKLSAEKSLSPSERQRRQVERDVENCQAVIEAAADFAVLMRQVNAEILASTPIQKAAA